MSRPSFPEGAVVAAALAVAGAIGAATLPGVLGTSAAMGLVVTILAAAYVAYLLRRGREKTGRIVVPCLWLALTLIGWALLPFPVFALLQIGLIWLIRTLYFHGGVLAALADVGLSAFALAAALWAARGTGSWLVTVWCFFLVQALFVWIPSLAPPSDPDPEPDDGFEEARALAEAALERLATSR